MYFWSILKSVTTLKNISTISVTICSFILFQLVEPGEGNYIWADLILGSGLSSKGEFGFVVA